MFEWYANRRPLITLNGVMAITLRYFTEFGKQSVAEFMQESIVFSSACTMSL